MSVVGRWVRGGLHASLEWVMAVVFGVVVGVRLVWACVRGALREDRVRDAPPPCLEHPSLGRHKFLKLQVGFGFLFYSVLLFLFFVFFFIHISCCFLLFLLLSFLFSSFFFIIFFSSFLLLLFCLLLFLEVFWQQIHLFIDLPHFLVYEEYEALIPFFLSIFALFYIFLIYCFA